MNYYEAVSCKLICPGQVEFTLERALVGLAGGFNAVALDANKISPRPLHMINTLSKPQRVFLTGHWMA